MVSHYVNLLRLKLSASYTGSVSYSFKDDWYNSKCHMY